LPDKQCQSDVMPTRMLKCNIDLLAPFLTELFNRSLPERGIKLLEQVQRRCLGAILGAILL